MGNKICDISEFNKVTDWKKLSEDVSLLIIRMGLRGSIFGTSNCGKIRYDYKFKEHVEGCKKYDIPYLIYFFPTSINDEEAVEEAKFIEDTVKEYDISSPVFLDSEMVNKGKGRADSLSKEKRTHLLNVIIDHLSFSGISSGIYASTSWFKDHLLINEFPDPVLKNTWVAQYSKTLDFTGEYLYWQYTNSGKVNGLTGSSKGVDLSVKKDGNMSKTNIGLLDYAKAQVGKPYWMGTFGQTASESLYKQKKRQLPSYYTASDFKSQYGKRVHDCAGLIKGYVWSDTPTSTPKYNASQDLSAERMYAVAHDRGNIYSIPKTPGILVFKGNSPSSIHHVGVYDGGDYVYEAKGHAYGVVKTKFNKSEWDYWAKSTLVSYISSSTSTTVNTEETKKKEETKTVAKQSEYDTDAVKVILGKYGNGNKRKEALGSRYNGVQARVNELLKNKSLLIEVMAQFVIDGYAGKGEARKKYLDGYYRGVQDKVNDILS